MSIHASEAEIGVIGCVLLRPECIHAFELTPEEFDDSTRRLLFRAIVSLVWDRGEPVDVITLAAECRRISGQPLPKLEDVITDIAARVPTSTNVVHWARMVRLAAIKRRVLIALSEQKTRIEGTDLEGIVAAVENMQQEVIGACDVQGKFDSMASLFDALIKRLKEDPTGENARVRTGIKAIDRICGGFPFGHPTMVGGRPSNGKTLLMRTILDNLAMKGVPVGYISLEDDPIDLVLWQCLRRARIGIERYIQGILTSEEITQIERLRAEVVKLPLDYCREPSLDGPQICQRIRQMVAQKGVRAVAVDYLQLVRVPGDRTLNEELGDAVTMLSAVAHKNNIAVIIGSQLNRESEKEKRAPQLSDFKACGGIEEAAQLAIFVHRQWKMKPDPQHPRFAKLLEAIVAKMKLGQTGTAKLYFEGALGYACDPEPGYFGQEMEGGVDFCKARCCEEYALWGEEFCGLHKAPRLQYSTAPAPRDWHDTDGEA